MITARRGVREVALSFDDGPSPYTSTILRILKRYRAHATFFQIGHNIPGSGAIERRILASSNTLGNHSFDHPRLPGFDQLRRTSARIRQVSGYAPCVFRPPYGAVDAQLVGEARRLGMATVTWDVDPRDWSRPGTGAIVSRVLGSVHAGSIVLMHDGGGPRDQTVAALPTVLRVLSQRQYHVVTVERLLRLERRYVP